MGKPEANDLRQGIVTLPVINYLDAHPGDRRVEALLRHGRGAEAAVLPIVEAVRASGAVDQAWAEAREFVARGQAALRALPDNDARQAMLQLADYVLTRSY
jgi:geranylgeranyl pyrophosphate synthase